MNKVTFNYMGVKCRQKYFNLFFSNYKNLLRGLLFICSSILLFSVTAVQADEATSTDREFIEMQTSINALMVAVVDWSAHEIWEASYKDIMTGQNWLTVKQYATELLVSGTLVSLGGMGAADKTWVRDPVWQEWSSKMIEETKEVLIAIAKQDQQQLRASGDRLVETCTGCHAVFKPRIPTEGILHIPHHEYGDPLSID